MDWLGISENGFYYIINQHRNKLIWERNDNWDWVIKMDLIELYKKSGDKKFELNDVKNFTPFILTKTKKSTDKKQNYILIGRGYN